MPSQDDTLCVHRWLLKEPEQGRVSGTCRRCGAQRGFSAGLEVPEGVPDYDEPPAADRELMTVGSAEGQVAA